MATKQTVACCILVTDTHSSTGLQRGQAQAVMGHQTLCRDAYVSTTDGGVDHEQHTEVWTEATTPLTQGERKLPVTTGLP